MSFKKMLLSWTSRGAHPRKKEAAKAATAATQAGDGATRVPVAAFRELFGHGHGAVFASGLRRGAKRGRAVFDSRRPDREPRRPHGERQRRSHRNRHAITTDMDGSYDCFESAISRLSRARQLPRKFLPGCGAPRPTASITRRPGRGNSGFNYLPYQVSYPTGVNVGTVNFSIPADNAAAPAFQILSTIINVDWKYTTTVLQQALNDPLEIDYPVTATRAFNPSDPNHLRIGLPQAATSQTDMIGHEFGHYVSYESHSFFAPVQNATDLPHALGYNHRFYNETTAARNPNDLHAVLTSDDMTVPFQEAWADYYCGMRQETGTQTTRR